MNLIRYLFFNDPAEPLIISSYRCVLPNTSYAKLLLCGNEQQLSCGRISEERVPRHIPSQTHPFSETYSNDIKSLSLVCVPALSLWRTWTKHCPKFCTLKHFASAVAVISETSFHLSLSHAAYVNGNPPPLKTRGGVDNKKARASPRSSHRNVILKVLNALSFSFLAILPRNYYRKKYIVVCWASQGGVALCVNIIPPTRLLFPA